MRCAAGARRDGRPQRAAVGVRAHPVLRVAVLLLRLQQGHHASTTSGPPSTSTLSSTRSRSSPTPWARPRRCRSCTSAAARRRSCRDAELTRLMATLRQRLRLAADAEIVDRGRPAHRRRRRAWRTWRRSASTASASACRTSTPSVQQAVHRVQPEAGAGADGERAPLGFESINVDLIYGLPLQTPASFARTVHKVGGPAARPHRAVRLRPPAAALQAAAAHRCRSSCRGPARAWRCCRPPSPASSAMATATSAWTTSRCPTTRWRWPSARAGCTATSRATARSPTAT